VVDHAPTLGDGAAVAALVLIAAFVHAGDAPQRGIWGEQEDCRELTFENVSTEHYDLGQQIVSGTLSHTGLVPVKNVKVCGNGVCTIVDEGKEMKKGESAEFVLKIPNLNAVVLGVECSALRSD
jgi:hypothetical protein